MSHVTKKEWYRRVNATWAPAGDRLPAMTAIEAVRAAAKLHRFALGVSFPGPIVVTSGNRYTYARGGTMYVNPERGGWHGFVHSLSHYLHGRYQRDNPESQGHGADHARMEIRMIKEVLKRGWLDGSLKDAPKPDMPAADIKAAARAKKYASILRRIETWEAKRRRAENALKKLGKQMRYYDKKIHGSNNTVH